MEIPKEVKSITDNLVSSGYQVYLVGGCLRDLLLEKKPKDWDLTTNAKPEEIQKIFPDSVYENKFGTVGIKMDSEDPTLKLIEVTTFRLEGKYTDKRHPDEIKFAKTVEEDLSRRDFTVNAIALKFPISNFQFPNLVDPFDGKADLENKLIRAVGNPNERFQEDALRLMRAVRLGVRLGFDIEKKTAEAVQKSAGLLEFIAKERIREELEKMLMADNAANGIEMMRELGLLKYAIKELEEGVDMEQNKHHIYTVFEHNCRALEYAAKNNFPLDLRLASLLHDVGKPRVRAWKSDSRGAKEYKGQKGDWTFYQHQFAGEKMALEIMDRLHFSKKMSEKVTLLVREHMFVYDPEIVTEKGVRRLVRRVGAENIDDLFLLREADRIGSGVEKAVPYRLRHLKAMIEKAKQAPLSPKMLKLNGEDIMKELKIEPGPKVGLILAALLEEVVDDPKLNTKQGLAKRAKEFGQLSDKELVKLGGKAKQSVADVQKRIDEEIKKKYFVK